LYQKEIWFIALPRSTQNRHCNKPEGFEFLQSVSDADEELSTKRTKSRLEWSLVGGSSTAAIEFLQTEFSVPGFTLAKNQTYETKSGKVQCFKCKGYVSYACLFKAKVL
jgi:hypothetical protein